MSILKNDLRRNFSQIPNELITDNRLSHAAFRVACYLHSRPDNWEINNKDIQRKLGISDRGSIAKYWKELIKCGWVARQEKDRADGKFSGYDYTLTMSGSTVAEKTRIGSDSPCREKPASDNTRSGRNPTLNNKEFLNNTDLLRNNDDDNADKITKKEIEEWEAQAAGSARVVSLKVESEKEKSSAKKEKDSEEKWGDEILADQMYVERTCLALKITPDQFRRKWDAFILQKKALEELNHRNANDLKKNFYFWLSKTNNYKTQYDVKNNKKSRANRFDKYREYYKQYETGANAGTATGTTGSV